MNQTPYFHTYKEYVRYDNYNRKLKFYYDEYLERVFTQSGFRKYLRYNRTLAFHIRSRKESKMYVDPLGRKSCRFLE